MKKILFCSDSPIIPTGYAQVTRNVGTRLKRAGFDFNCLGFQQWSMPISEIKYQEGWLNFPLFPVLSAGEFYGNQGSIEYWVNNLRPNITIFLLDSFMLRHLVENKLRGNVIEKTMDKIKNVTSPWMYFPFDSADVYAGAKEVLEAMDVRIAMSKFAQKLLKDQTGLDSFYIPHGCFYEETLVDTPYGEVKIKDLKSGDLVWGVFGLGSKEHEPGERLLTEITETHPIRLKDNMLLIITESGHFMEITKDNPVMVDGFEYKPAGDLRIGEKLYISSGANSNYDKLGVFGGDNRWGGKHKFDSMQSPQKKGKTSFTKNIYNKFKSRTKRIVEVRWLENSKTLVKQFDKKEMLPGRIERVQNISDSPKHTSILGDKKETSRIINRIFGKQIIKKEKQIHRRGTRTSKPNKKIKHDVICCIVEFEPTYSFVYDITTTTHNFFANGIIVHNCDTLTYRPLPKEYVEKFKIQMGIQNKFVVGSVFRNQTRKLPSKLIKAFKIFSDRHDDVVLLLHTDANDPQGQNLIDLIEKIKLDKNKVKFTNMNFISGVSNHDVNLIYNMMDCHTLSTTGEGFGLPIIESQSAGIPNIITDYTTSRELIEGHGQLVKVKDFIEGQMNTNRAMIDIEDMANCFDKYYNDRELMRKHGIEARKFTLEHYNWDKIMRKWIELLTFGEIFEGD